MGLSGALVWRLRVGMSVAFIAAIAGCGPSEEARLDEAIAQARIALSEDRLDEAEVSLRDAETLRPNAPAVRQGLDDLAAIRASRDTFIRAEALIRTGALLEARRLFQTVPRVDWVRYSQAREYVAELEQEWVVQFREHLDQLLIDLDPGQLLRAIRGAKAVLPTSPLVEAVIRSRSEQALTAAGDVATELVQEDVAAAERLLDAIEALFSRDHLEKPASFVAATELVAREMARLEQQRVQEWQAAQREIAQPPRPSSGAPGPTVTSPVRPAVPAAPSPSLPETSPVPQGPQSCPTFDPGIRASLGFVSGVITEDRYGMRRLRLSFDGSIDNVSSGWMQVWLHSYVLYFGDARENHPGQR